MNKTIHSLRQRPDHHKKVVAFSVSFFLTALVFSVWFSTQTFLKTGTDEQIIAQSKSQTTDKSPFSVFKDTLASGYAAITGK